jgi:hypothetical protein
MVAETLEDEELFEEEEEEETGALTMYVPARRSSSIT